MSGDSPRRKRLTVALNDGTWRAISFAPLIRGCVRIEGESVETADCDVLGCERPEAQGSGLHER